TINKIKFAKLHVFPYSKRKGTVASKMDNQVDNVTKKRRVRELLKLSKKLETDAMNQFLNKEIEFIPEVYQDGYLIGHSGNYLLVKINGEKDLINKLINVKVKSIEYPFVVATKIDNHS